MYVFLWLLIVYERSLWELPKELTQSKVRCDLRNSLYEKGIPQHTQSVYEQLLEHKPRGTSLHYFSAAFLALCPEKNTWKILSSENSCY